MKMVAGLLVVLLAALALPAAYASTEMRDVITGEAYENLVKSGAIQGISMTKTIISNPFLEEAIVNYAKNKLGGGAFYCGDTCAQGKCYTPDCKCFFNLCLKNSLDM